MHASVGGADTGVSPVRMTLWRQRQAVTGSHWPLVGCSKSISPSLFDHRVQRVQLPQSLFDEFNVPFLLPVGTGTGMRVL